MSIYTIPGEPDITALADGDSFLVHDTSASATGEATMTVLRAYLNTVVNVTAATLAVTAASHNNRIITLNKADGIAVTLPAATGSGLKLHFITGTTFTSDATIKVTGDDTMTGTALLAQDSADTAVVFETAASSDTITFNGSTTGGIKGDSVELIDIAADLWWVRVHGSATGTEATPFSATVS